MAGIFLSSFVVLVGATGVLFTAASVLQLVSAWVAAVTTTLILLVYTWKSAPQTLALGLFGSTEETTAAML